MAKQLFDGTVRILTNNKLFVVEKLEKANIKHWLFNMTEGTVVMVDHKMKIEHFIRACRKAGVLYDNYITEHKSTVKYLFDPKYMPDKRWAVILSIIQEEKDHLSWTEKAVKKYRCQIWSINKIQNSRSKDQNDKGELIILVKGKKEDLGKLIKAIEKKGYLYGSHLTPPTYNRIDKNAAIKLALYEVLDRRDIENNQEYQENAGKFIRQKTIEHQNDPKTTGCLVIGAGDYRRYEMKEFKQKRKEFNKNEF